MPILYRLLPDQPPHLGWLALLRGRAIWGTGLGPISGDDAVIPPVGNLTSDAVVLIGGHTVTPDYAGRSGSYPAIDQINFKVPNGVTGCFVPVAVKGGNGIGSPKSGVNENLTVAEAFDCRSGIVCVPMSLRAQLR